MITYPNAKINLGLNITEKRMDGFHNIETIFVPIPSLCDILEILPSTNQNEPIVFTQTGLKVEGDLKGNLCVKAYNLLKKHTQLPHVAMHLHKQIPMGAGLGGGSADGAFALKMLNQIAEQPLLTKNLDEIALELGSDCPFFLRNYPCYARSRGEILERIAIPLKGYHILMVNTGVHINTGLAYQQSMPSEAAFKLTEITSHPIGDWKKLISNDFERIVFTLHPNVMRIKEELYEMGAVYASMSGSGSTVFGFFKNKPILDGKFKTYFIHNSLF